MLAGLHLVAYSWGDALSWEAGPIWEKWAGVSCLVPSSATAAEAVPGYMSPPRIMKDSKGLLPYLKKRNQQMVAKLVYGTHTHIYIYI